DADDRGGYNRQEGVRGNYDEAPSNRYNREDRGSGMRSDRYGGDSSPPRKAPEGRPMRGGDERGRYEDRTPSAFGRGGGMAGRGGERGERSPARVSSPSRGRMDEGGRGGGGYGAPPGRGAYDGGGRGGYDRKDDRRDDRRDDRPPRGDDSGFNRRDAHDDRVPARGMDRDRAAPRDGRDGRSAGGNYGNDVREERGVMREENRGGDRFENRRGDDRDGGFGGRRGGRDSRDDRGGRDGGGRGGFGGDRGERDGGGGFGGGRGGYSGDRDRDGGGRPSFGEDRNGGKFGSDRDRDGGFGAGRGGGNEGFSRGGGRGGFGQDRDAGFGGGGYGGGRGGRGGYGGDRGESNGFGSSRDEGGFGSGRGGGGGFNDRSEDRFGGGRGGYSGGRGGRGGGGFGGDRGGGFGSDRNEGGFGREEGGFGGRGFTSSSFGNRPGRDMDELNFDGERKYARRGYESQVRSVAELYESDARNAENQILDADVDVTVSGKDADALHPITSWEESRLDQNLIDICVNRCKYKIVRPIQAKGIPAIMTSRDILAQSETGSGKSAAFMLPIVHEIITANRPMCGGKVIAIMVAPTRELVQQLHEQAIRFTKSIEGINVVCSIGQSAFGKTINTLMNDGAHILVATTGRLKSHVEQQHIALDSLRYFVLDEADRMLEDKGGTREMEFIFNHPRWPKGSPDLQFLLFSATMPQSVKSYAASLLRKDFLTITPNTDGANKKIKQLFHKCEGALDKNNLCHSILLKEAEECEAESRPFRKTLVFVNKKDATNALAIAITKKLENKGIFAQSLHGDKGQDLRDEAIRKFRSGEVKILVGTDVCERGLDIEGLEHVINFDMPNEGERYTHRIGRTGRVRNGMSTSFVVDTDSRILPIIVQIVKASNQEVPDWMDALANGRGGGGGGFGSGNDGGFGSGGGGGSGFGSRGGGFDSVTADPFGGGFDAAPAAGGGGGWGAADAASNGNGFGSGGGFDSGSNGFGAPAENGERKTEEGNPFDMGRVSEAVTETVQATPTPTIPTEFSTQNNAVDEDDW
ncbi:hypothetical protein PENTCL1PPCAC_2182, partial [Pristionchus entomophagus]